MKRISELTVEHLQTFWINFVHLLRKDKIY